MICLGKMKGKESFCDFVVLHPSTSRQHAVIQHRKEDSFLYDLNSTHHTFLNKKKIPPKAYQKLRNGDFIRFGESTRSYVVCGVKCEEKSEQEEFQGSVEEAERKIREQRKRREEMLVKKVERKSILEMIEEAEEKNFQEELNYDPNAEDEDEEPLRKEERVEEEESEEDLFDEANKKKREADSAVNDLLSLKRKREEAIEERKTLQEKISALEGKHKTFSFCSFPL